MLALALLAWLGCGASGPPDAQPPARGGRAPGAAPGECLRDEDCPALEHCFGPGVPRCGGADREPAHCPSDRPYWIAEGCSERCSAEPPPSCRDGFVCTDGAVCRPSAQGADAHGCAHLPCEWDSECGSGRCVSGRCYDAPGRCEEMPARPESGPTGATARPAPGCPDDQIEVEQCITNGMPILTPEGPRASRSCITSCQPTPPGGSAAMPCAERSPRHFVCEGYAP